MLSGRDLMLLKVAALLHDPPHKAWIVLNKYRVSESLEEGQDIGHELKAHEREARRLATKILEGTPLEGAVGLMFEDIVKQADRLASSIDRVLHSSEESGGRRPWGTVDVANMFDPNPKHGRIKNEGKVPNKDAVSEYAKKLNDVLRETVKNNDYVTAYHALYALMEAQWFKEVSLVGPADTRIPNHTIFDHLYATATAVNIVASKARGKPYGGFLILLDITGIQSFISKARKASDYWAGSWLISAIAWYLVREVIEKIGPDCLVMPTARANPFYLTWLLGRAKVRGYSKLAKTLENTFNKLVKYGWPRDPVIPGTLVLILPGNALQILGTAVNDDVREAVREYFLNRYVEVWREVVDAVKEGLGKDVSDALALIEDTPPTLLRVNVVDFSEVHDELLRKIREYADAFLYHHALTKLFSKKLSEIISVEPGSFLDWEKVIGSSGNYELCSVCGKLPAVTEKLAEKLSGEIKDKLLIKRKGGREEKLCPYCLVKRAIRYYGSGGGVLNRVVERLVGQGVKVREGSEVVFPSTSDVAALWAKLELLRVVNRVRDTRVVNDLLNEVIKLLSRKPPSIKDLDRIEGIPTALRDELSRIKECWGDEDPRYLLALLLVMEDAEDLMLSSENILGKVVKSIGSNLLSEYLRKVEGSIRKYYVILKADADNMGEILSGRKALVDHEGDWRERREEVLAKYYEEVLGEEVLREHPESGDAVWDSAKRLNLVLEKYEKLFNIRGNRKVFMPVSLSYHSCASRALMMTALKDIEIVGRYGSVIYAGGDDLLALVPTVARVCGSGEVTLTLLDAVISTREAFWASTKDGFLRGAGVSPALRAAGRSYSLMIAHYKDPMGVLIEQAEEGLGKAKDAELKKLNGDEVGKKDSTCIMYGRGSPQYVVIPNRVGGERYSTLRALGELFTMVKGGVISEGTPRDVESWEEAILGVLRGYRNNSVEKAINVLRYVLKRNSRHTSWKRIEGFISDYIQELKDFTVTGEEEPEAWVPLTLFKALKLVQGGDR